MLFCVLFGLSMDYEAFLLSHVKEAHDAGAVTVASVIRGLERSGRIITSAAAIVVLVSLSFVAADIILIKALGLGYRDRGLPRRHGCSGASGAGHDALAGGVELVGAPVATPVSMT